jgi:hypothetical protein
MAFPLMQAARGRQAEMRRAAQPGSSGARRDSL